MVRLPIPDDDHVVRYCRPGTCAKGRILISAFELRDGELCISVNWMEHPKARSVTGVREALRKKGLGLSRNGRFAKMSVRSIRRAAKSATLAVYVKHKPTCDDQSHALICGPRQTEDDRYDVAAMLHGADFETFEIWPSGH